MTNATRTEDEVPQNRPYFIDPDGAEASRRSLPVLVANRLCYMCRQGYEDDQIVVADPQDFIDLIVGHCSDEQDFLLPDTPMKEAIFRVLLGNSNEPMKEAIFRVLLGNSNEPMTAAQISAELSSKLPPAQRATSPDVIQRLLDNSAYYCIGPAPEPDPESEEDA